MARGLWEKQHKKQHCDSYCRIKIVVVLLVRLWYETIYSSFCDAICYLLARFQEVPECTSHPGEQRFLRISSQLKRVDRISRLGASLQSLPEKTMVNCESCLKPSKDTQ